MKWKPRTLLTHTHTHTPCPLKFPTLAWPMCTHWHSPLCHFGWWHLSLMYSRNKENIICISWGWNNTRDREIACGDSSVSGHPVCVCVGGESFLFSLTPSFTTTCLGHLLISQVPFPNWKWRWNTEHVLVFWKGLRALCMRVQLCPTFLLPHGLYVAHQAPLFVGFSR